MRIATCSAITLLMLGAVACGSEPAVLPEDYASCGQTSLYLVCLIQGMDVEWERVKNVVGPPDNNGYQTFEDLSKAAAQLGLHAVGLHTNRAGVTDLPMPAIIQVRDPQETHARAHLVVLLRSTLDGVYLLD